MVLLRVLADLRSIRGGYSIGGDLVVEEETRRGSGLNHFAQFFLVVYSECLFYILHCSFMSHVW